MTSIILLLQESEEGDDESDGSVDSATKAWIAEEKVAEDRSKANDDKASSKRKSVKEPKPKKETKKAQRAREKAENAEKARIEAAAAAGTAAGELAAAAAAGAAAGALAGELAAAAAAGALAGAASAALLNQDQHDNDGIASGDNSGKTPLFDCNPVVQGSRAKQPAKKLSE